MPQHDGEMPKSEDALVCIFRGMFKFRCRQCVRCMLMRYPWVFLWCRLTVQYPCCRYTAVAMPMLYNTRYSSRRRVTVMIALVWFLSFAISCPLLFGLNNTGTVTATSDLCSRVTLSRCCPLYPGLFSPQSVTVKNAVLHWSRDSDLKTFSP